jgi:hypothetical protein
MSQSRDRRLGRFAVAAPAILALATLTGCFDGNDDKNGTPAPTPAPTASPTPSPTATPTGFNVTRCLNQAIPGTGLTVAQAVVPDTLKLVLSAPSGFPNGRRLSDPVIDVTLAVIFLDLTTHAPDTLAKLPLNPPANDLPFRNSFPYLAPPQGSPPLADTGATTFNFRTDAEAAYVRVDRMGMPAVATALISQMNKTGYNNASPAVDAQGVFVPDITSTLTGLTNALADDLIGAGLTPCATRS